MLALFFSCCACWFNCGNYSNCIYGNPLINWATEKNALNITGNETTDVFIFARPTTVAVINCLNVSNFLQKEFHLNSSEARKAELKMKYVSELKTTFNDFKVIDISPVFGNLSDFDKTPEKYYNFQIEKKSLLIQAKKLPQNISLLDCDEHFNLKMESNVDNKDESESIGKNDYEFLGGENEDEAYENVFTTLNSNEKVTNDDNNSKDKEFFLKDNKNDIIIKGKNVGDSFTNEINIDTIWVNGPIENGENLNEKERKCFVNCSENCVYIKVKAVYGQIKVRKSAFLTKQNITCTRHDFGCDIKPIIKHECNQQNVCKYDIGSKLLCGWRHEGGIISESNFNAIKWQFINKLEQSEVDDYFKRIGREIDEKMNLKDC